MADLVRFLHGPVLAEPADGHQSVLIYADSSRAELAGTCGVCGARLWQRLEPVVYSVSDDDRRKVILGRRPVVCVKCREPVWWVADRRLVRRLRRHWTRHRGRATP